MHFKDPLVGQRSRSPRLTAEMRRSIDEDAATAPDMPDFRRLTRGDRAIVPFEAAGCSARPTARRDPHRRAARR